MGKSNVIQPYDLLRQISNATGHNVFSAEPIPDTGAGAASFYPLEVDTGYFDANERYQASIPAFIPSGDPETDRRALQNARYKNRGHIRNIANAIPRIIGKGLVYAAQGAAIMASITPAAIKAVGDAANPSKDLDAQNFSAIFDNFVLDRMDEIGGWVDNTFPHYGSSDYAQKNLYGRMGESKFWLGEGGEAISFLGSSYLLGTGAVKLLGTMSRLASLAGKVNPKLSLSSKVAQAMEASTLGKPLTKSQKFHLGADTHIAAATNTVVEAGVEAHSVNKQLMEEYRRGEWGTNLSEEEAKMEAAKRANATFLFNVPVIYFPNLLQAKWFKANSRITREHAQQALDNKGIKLGGRVKESVYGTLSESWQEGIQSALERYETNLLNGHDKVVKRKDYSEDHGIFSSMYNIGNEFIAGLGDTDQQSAMFLGGLIGAISGGVGKHIENKEISNNLKQLIKGSTIVDSVYNENYKSLYKKHKRFIIEKDAEGKDIEKETETYLNSKGEFEYDSDALIGKADRLRKEQNLFTESILASLAEEDVHGDMVKATHIANLASMYFMQPFGDIILKEKLKRNLQKSEDLDEPNLMAEMAKNESLVNFLADEYAKMTERLTVSGREYGKEFNELKLRASLYEAAKTFTIREYKKDKIDTITDEEIKKAKTEEVEAVLADSKKFVNDFTFNDNSIYTEWATLKKAKEEYVRANKINEDTKKNNESTEKELEATNTSFRKATFDAYLAEQTFEDKLLSSNFFKGTKETFKQNIRSQVFRNIMMNKKIANALSSLDEELDFQEVNTIKNLLLQITTLKVPLTPDNKEKIDELLEKAKAFYQVQVNFSEEEMNKHKSNDNSMLYMVEEFIEALAGEDIEGIIKFANEFQNYSEIVTFLKKLLGTTDLDVIKNNILSIVEGNVFHQERIGPLFELNNFSPDRLPTESMETNIQTMKNYLKDLENYKDPTEVKFTEMAHLDNAKLDQEIVKHITDTLIENNEQIIQQASASFALGVFTTNNLTGILIDSITIELGKFLKEGKFKNVEKSKIIEKQVKVINELLKKIQAGRVKQKAQLSATMQEYETDLLNGLSVVNNQLSVNDFLALSENDKKSLLIPLQEEYHQLLKKLAANILLYNPDTKTEHFNKVYSNLGSAFRMLSLFVKEVPELSDFVISDRTKQVTFDALVLKVAKEKQAELTDIFNTYKKLLGLNTAILAVSSGFNFKSFYEKLITEDSEYSLSPEQLVVAEQILMFTSSTKQVTDMLVLDGAAGTGKTFMLSKIFPKDSVFVASPYEHMQKNLEDNLSSKVFDLNSIPITDDDYNFKPFNIIFENLDKIIDSSTAWDVYKNSVVVIDEVYALTRKQQIGLIRLAIKKNIKFILVGDPNQKGRFDGLREYGNVTLSYFVRNTTPLSTRFRSFVTPIAAIQEAVYGKTNTVAPITTTYNNHVGVQGTENALEFFNVIQEREKLFPGRSRAIVVDDAAVNALTNLAKARGLKVKVNTVSQVQGKEYDEVYINLSAPTGIIGNTSYYLELYTALSRARLFMLFNNESRPLVKSSFDSALKEDTEYKKELFENNKKEFSKHAAYRTGNIVDIDTVENSEVVRDDSKDDTNEEKNSDEFKNNEGFENNKDDDNFDEPDEDIEKSFEEKEINSSVALQAKIRAANTEYSRQIEYPINSNINNLLEKKEVYYFDYNGIALATIKVEFEDEGIIRYNVIGSTTILPSMKLNSGNVFMENGFPAYVTSAGTPVSNDIIVHANKIHFFYSNSETTTLSLEETVAIVKEKFKIESFKLGIEMKSKDGKLNTLINISEDYSNLNLIAAKNELDAGFPYLVLYDIKTMFGKSMRPLFVKLKPGLYSETELQPLKLWTKEMEKVTSALTILFPTTVTKTSIGGLIRAFKSVKEKRQIIKDPNNNIIVNEQDIEDAITAFITSFLVENEEGTVVFNPKVTTAEKELITLMINLQNKLLTNSVEGKAFYTSLIHLTDLYYGVDTVLKHHKINFGEETTYDKIANEKAQKAVDEKNLTDTENNWKFSITSRGKNTSFQLYYEKDNKKIYEKEEKLKAAQGEAAKIFIRIVNANRKRLGVLRSKISFLKEYSSAIKFVAKHLTGGYLVHIKEIENTLFKIKENFNYSEYFPSSEAKSDINVLLQQLETQITIIEKELKNPTAVTNTNLKLVLEEFEVLRVKVFKMSKDPSNTPLSVENLNDLLEFANVHGLRRQIKLSIFNRFAAEFNKEIDIEKQQKLLDDWNNEFNFEVHSDLEHIERTTVIVKPTDEEKASKQTEKERERLQQINIQKELEKVKQEKARKVAEEIERTKEKIKETESSLAKKQETVVTNDIESITNQEEEVEQVNNSPKKTKKKYGKRRNDDEDIPEESVTQEEVLKEVVDDIKKETEEFIPNNQTSSVQEVEEQPKNDTVTYEDQGDDDVITTNTLKLSDVTLKVNEGGKLGDRELTYQITDNSNGKVLGRVRINKKEGTNFYQIGNVTLFPSIRISEEEYNGFMAQVIHRLSTVFKDIVSGFRKRTLINKGVGKKVYAELNNELQEYELISDDVRSHNAEMMWQSLERRGLAEKIQFKGDIIYKYKKQGAVSKEEKVEEKIEEKVKEKAKDIITPEEFKIMAKRFMPDIEDNEIFILRTEAMRLLNDGMPVEGFVTGKGDVFVRERDGGVSKRIARHELFHRVFSHYIKLEDRLKLIKSYEDSYGIYTNTVTNYMEWEENLARRFEEYTVSKSKILNYLKKFFNKIAASINYITAHEADIRNLFIDIEMGKFHSKLEEVSFDQGWSYMNEKRYYEGSIDEDFKTPARFEAAYNAMAAILAHYSNNAFKLNNNSNTIQYMPTYHTKEYYAPVYSPNEKYEILMEALEDEDFKIEPIFAEGLTILKEIHQQYMKDKKANKNLIASLLLEFVPSYVPIKSNNSTINQLNVIDTQESDENLKSAGMALAAQIMQKDKVNTETISLSSALKEFVSTIKIYHSNGRITLLDKRLAYYKLLQLLSGVDLSTSFEKIQLQIFNAMVKEGNNITTRALGYRLLDIIKSSFNLINKVEPTLNFKTKEIYGNPMRFLNSELLFFPTEKFFDAEGKNKYNLYKDKFGNVIEKTQLMELVELGVLNVVEKQTGDYFEDFDEEINEALGLEDSNKFIKIEITKPDGTTSLEKFYLEKFDENTSFNIKNNDILYLIEEAYNANLLAQMHDIFVSQAEKTYKILEKTNNFGYFGYKYFTARTLTVGQAAQAQALDFAVKSIEGKTETGELKKTKLEDNLDKFYGQFNWADAAKNMINLFNGEFKKWLSEISNDYKPNKGQTVYAFIVQKQEELKKADPDSLTHFQYILTNIDFKYLKVTLAGKQYTLPFQDKNVSGYLFAGANYFDSSEALTAVMLKNFGINNPNFYLSNPSDIFLWGTVILKTIYDGVPERIGYTRTATESEASNGEEQDVHNNREEISLTETVYEYVERMYGSRMHSIGNIATRESSFLRPTTIKSADGSPRYLFSPSSYSLQTAKHLLASKDAIDYRGRPIDSKYVPRPDFFDNPFYSLNPFVRTENQRRIVSVIDHDQTKQGDKLTEFSKENEIQFYEREFIGGFLTNLTEGKQNYFMFLNPLEDRPTTFGFELGLRLERSVKNDFILLLKQLSLRPAQSNVSDYNRKSLVGLGLLKRVKDIDITYSAFVDKIFNGTYDQKILEIVTEKMLEFLSEDSTTLAKNMIKLGVALPEDLIVRAKTLSTYLKKDTIDILENYEDQGSKKFKGPNVFDEDFSINNHKRLVKALADLVNIWSQNNYVNSYFLSQVLLGDTAYFKNSMARIKRSGGAAAPGNRGVVNPALGIPEKIRAVVITDAVMDIKDNPLFTNIPEYRGKSGNFKYTDGATFILPERFDMLERMFSFDKSLGGLIKSAYYSIHAEGMPLMLKNSIVVLSDALVDEHPELKILRDNLRRVGAMEAYYPTAIKLGQSVPAFDSSRMNKLLNENDVLELENSIFEISNKDLKIQSNPTKTEEESVSNWSQLPYFLNVMSETYEEAKNVYKAMAELYELNLEEFKANITKEDIKERLLRAAKGSNASDFVTMIKGKVDLNFPLIQNRALTYLISIFSKSVLEVKFKGGKMVLVSDQFFKNPKTNKRLGVVVENGKLAYEVLLPSYMKKYVNEGDIVGIRIPTTEIHSATPLKVVGFYDSVDTNAIVCPRELIKITGADFDVDSLFVIRRERNSKAYVNYRNESKEKRSIYFETTAKLKKELELLEELVKKAEKAHAKKSRIPENKFFYNYLTEEEIIKINPETGKEEITFEKVVLRYTLSRLKKERNKKENELKKEQEKAQRAENLENTFFEIDTITEPNAKDAPAGYVNGKYNEIELKTLREEYWEEKNSNKPNERILKILKAQLEALLKNLIIENYLSALQKEDSRKRMLSPVTMLMFNEKGNEFDVDGLYAEGTVNRFIQDLKLEQNPNITEAADKKELVSLQEEFDLNNPLSKGRAFSLVFAGQDLTGVFANFTKSAAYSIKNGIKVKTNIVDHDYFYIGEDSFSKGIEKEIKREEELLNLLKNNPEAEDVGSLLYELETIQSNFNKVQVSSKTPGAKIAVRKRFEGDTVKIFSPVLKKPIKIRLEDGNEKTFYLMQDDFKTWQLLDALVNAAIDNLAEQILPTINANQRTASAILGGVIIGIDIKILTLLMNQSIIKELSNVNYSKLIQRELKKLSKDKQNELDKNDTVSVKELRDNFSNQSPSSEFNVKVLRLFNKLSTAGEGINEMSGAIVPLKKIPTTFAEIEQVFDSWKKVFEQNETIHMHDVEQEIPHIMQMKKVMDFLKEELIENLFFIDSKAVTTALNTALEVFVNPRLNTYNSFENKRLIKEQFVRFLLMGLTEENIDPITIRFTGNNNKRHTKILTGNQAYVHHVAKELEAILFEYNTAKKLASEDPTIKVAPNIFLEGLQIFETKFGYYSVRFTAATNFQDIDVFKLAVAMKTIPTGFDGKDFESKVTSEDLMNKLVMLGLVTNGLNAGQNTYNKGLPTSDIKAVSEVYAKTLEVLQKYPEHLHGQVIKFLIQLSAKFPEGLPYIRSKNAKIIKNEYTDPPTYSGVAQFEDLNIFYDLAFNKINEEYVFPLIIKSGTYDTAYILLYETENTAYYVKLHGIKNFSNFNFNSSYDVAEFFRPDIPVFKVENFTTDAQHNVTITNDKIPSYALFYVSKKVISDNSDRILVMNENGKYVQITEEIKKFVETQLPVKENVNNQSKIDETAEEKKKKNDCPLKNIF